MFVQLPFVSYGTAFTASTAIAAALYERTHSGKGQKVEVPMYAGSVAMQATGFIIGDEILSGRTEDKNLAYLAQWLGKLGIHLSEVRVVLDDESDIIEAVNSLRKRYDYVFTTGGIGPTHDDITTDSIAKAFGVKTKIDDEALIKMKEYLAGKELTEPLIKIL